MQFARAGSTLVVALFTSVSAYAADDTQFAEITIDVPTVKQQEDPLAAGRLGSGDTAMQLSDQPGVSLNTGGGVSSLPAIHAMADDRVKQLVDGMPITSACANHMNPTLSYVAPSNVAQVAVIAGLTPVSMGGDSIAGTISVNSPAPVFAATGEKLVSGSLSGFYRSINHGSTVTAQANVASDSVSLAYAGSRDRADSYKDGHGNLVRDTLYESMNQQLTFAAKGDGLLVVKVGTQYIPYQGYVNQRMDMVGNRGNSLNADYRRDYGWGKLDTRVYWQDTKHEMGFFTPEKTGTMPMNTHGKDIGYALKAELPLSLQNTLRVGNEFHRFRLDDWWPAVAGSAMMSPNTYVNINNGRRDVFSLYAEQESKWDARWNSVLGVRTDRVSMDTGDVQGYGCAMAPCVTDANAAAAFNAVSHARHDNNYDLSALARYEADQTSSYEFGYARKTRSPNLYERYAWGRSQMAMNMIGWFGDANGYVGNLDLKPEVANTVSATAAWHNDAAWQASFTPYYTYVQNYIGVDLLNTYVSGGSTFANFQFANHDARIYGVDFSGKLRVWSNDHGTGTLKTIGGWTRGIRTDTGGSLYRVMPFHASVTLEQSVRSWTNALELQSVAGKNKVDTLRNEPATPGYTLVNLRSTYEIKNLRLDFGIDNLFSKFYYLPLGGVDYADWKADGMVGQISAVAGPGRSVNAGMTMKF
jgi:iron complex outermembrane receptor protein